MAEKTVHTRIINKHDTEENWSKAINFIPKQGELIIYDIDETHDHERIKIGDGETLVNSLPFLNIDTDTTLTKTGEAADAQITGEYLAYRSQGLSANDYRISSPGWKRLAVLIRGNSGQIDINLSRNDQVYGRHSQNIVLGYSGIADHPSMKWINARPGTANRRSTKELNSKPYLWQIVNHYDGENVDMCSQDHLMFIDKVRIAYPVNWDDIDTSMATEEEIYEYQNPINIYLDIHVVTGQDLAAVKRARGTLEFNITGHTWNNRACAFYEEKDCMVDEVTGYVLGEFNNVKCQTYEFQLFNESSMYVKDLARFDQLCVDNMMVRKETVCRVNTSTVDGVDNLRILGDSVKYNRIKNVITFGDACEYVVQPYRKNLAVPMDSADIANINSSGVSLTKKSNGIYETNGTASKDTFTLITRQIPRTHSTANAAPIVLKAGKTYYIRDCILVVLPESEFRDRIANSGAFKWADTHYGTMDQTTCAEVTIPNEENMVVEAIAFQFSKGQNYNLQQFYPQICERREDLVWSTELYDMEAMTIFTGYLKDTLPEKLYSPRATVRTGDESHLPLGVDDVVGFDMWSFDRSPMQGQIVLDTMVPRKFYAEIQVSRSGFYLDREEMDYNVYVNEIVVPGILETDTPDVHLMPFSGSLEEELFNMVEDVTTNNGTIVISLKVPSDKLSIMENDNYEGFKIRITEDR